MWTSTRAARLAVVLLLCLPTALACQDTGDDAGGSAGGGTSGGGVPAPGSGGGSGSRDGGAKPGPLKIPEWGRNGALFDDNSVAGKVNWAELKGIFVQECKDGTLCVNLVRVYRTEEGQPVDGPCGYDHVEPAAGTWAKRQRTVYVVGVCASETGESGGTGESGESGATGESGESGATGESGESGGSPTVQPSPSTETVPTT